MRISTWLYLAEQTLCSLCLLLSLGLCANLPRRAPLRLLGTAFCTALITWCAAQWHHPWLRLAVLAPTVALSPLLAWPGIPKRLRLRVALLAGLLSLWLTGTLRLLSPLLAAFGLLVGCAAVTLLPCLGPQATDLPRCTTIEIRHGGAKLSLTALIDSGNLLRDVITGLPVVMISQRAAARLIPLPKEGQLTPGMRLMTVRTVSGTAMMAIFRPDRVSLLVNGTWRPVRTLIGLSPDGYDGFQALVPATLMATDALTEHVLTQGG